MEKHILGAVVFSMIFIAGTAFALSDLQITNLEYSANTNRLVATLQNKGDDEAADVLVYFYEQDKKIGEAVQGEKIPAGQSFSVYIDYALAGGEHKLQAMADPLNTIEESNEANNERTVNLIISENATKSVVPYTREELARQQTLASLKSLGFYTGILVIVLAFLALFFTKIKHASLHRAAGQEISMRQEEYKEAKGKSIFSRIRLPKRTTHEHDELQTAGTEAEPKPAAEESLMKIADVARQPAGTAVRFRARLKYQDKIGKDYAYFLSDDSEHIIGFSKSNIDKKEAVVQGFTEHLLGDNTAVMIERAEEL